MDRSSFLCTTLSPVFFRCWSLCMHSLHTYTHTWGLYETTVTAYCYDRVYYYFLFISTIPIWKPACDYCIYYNSAASACDVITCIHWYIPLKYIKYAPLLRLVIGVRICINYNIFFLLLSITRSSGRST